MSAEPHRVRAAWTPAITGAGRRLPERWRIGSTDRQRLLTTIASTIEHDIVHVAGTRVADGLDPMDAGVEASELWRELIDDAVCRAMTTVLAA